MLQVTADIKPRFPLISKKIQLHPKIWIASIIFIRQELLQECLVSLCYIITQRDRLKTKDSMGELLCGNGRTIANCVTIGFCPMLYNWWR